MKQAMTTRQKSPHIHRAKKKAKALCFAHQENIPATKADKIEITEKTSPTVVLSFAHLTIQHASRHPATNTVVPAGMDKSNIAGPANIAASILQATMNTRSE